jgi:hypothetical protein
MAMAAGRGASTPRGGPAFAGPAVENEEKNAGN